MNTMDGSRDLSNKWNTLGIAGVALLMSLAAGCAEISCPAPKAAPAEAMTQKAFFKAVNGGDLAAVRAAVAAHPEWVMALGGHWEAPPLHYAAFEGHTEIAKLLIDKGADVSAHHPKYRYYPIHEAAMSGNTEIVRLLLDHGADLNVENHDHLTPLFMAAGEGHRDVVLLLLERGAAVDGRSESGWTLLHVAANRGDVELAKLLLAKGLAVDAPTEAHRTALHWASTEAMARLLIDAGAAVESRGPDGRTPLHLAAFFGFTDVVDVLLAHEAAVNAIDAASRTPLDLATAEGHDETAALLQSRGGSARGRAAAGPTGRTRTRIGSRGQFYLNDEPIIPIGVWQQPPILFSYNRALGMDCLVYPPAGGITDRSSTPGYVLAAQEHGLGVFLHYNDSLVDLPGVWGWSGGGWPIDAARRKYEQLRRDDDGRVIICNFGGHGFVKGDKSEHEFYRSVLPYIDCLVPHVWPEMFGDEPRNLRNVALLVDTARKLCEGRPRGEVSIWADINPHEWDKNGKVCQAPTVAEFTYQIWLALIHGADGICLFTISFDPFVFSQVPALMEENLPRIFNRVRAFAPHLASEPSPRAIAVRGDDPDSIVDFTTRRYQGADYVFVVNGEKDQTVRLEVDGLDTSLALHDALADEALAAADGTYESKMKALELRIWRIAPGDGTD